jgi:hypothetical protein
LPDAFGANVIVSVELWPAAMASGKLGGTVLNPDPVTAICEMVMLGPPGAEELLSVIDSALLLPTFTLPKSREFVFSSRSAELVLLPGAAATPPPQELAKTAAATIKISRRL